MLSTLAHLNQAAVGATATVTGHGLRHDGRGGVRGDVNHLRTGVLVLTLASERDGQGLTLGVLANHVDGGVLLGDLRTDVAVHPFHGVLLQHNLNHCGVQGVGLVHGGGAALDVVNVRALVSND